MTGLIARHAAEIQKLEFKAGVTIGTSEGLTAEEVATQEIDRAKLGEIDKAKLLSALGELDALLKYLPAEVSGRVGGFYQLAKGTMGEKTPDRVLHQAHPHGRARVRAGARQGISR